MSKDDAKKEQIGEIKLRNVRLSFAALDKPAKDSVNEKTGETIKGKFKGNLLLDKKDPETKAKLKLIKETAQKVLEAKFGKDNVPKLKPERVCLRDGDLEDWDGYEGCFYVSANNGSKPTVVDRSREPVEPGDKQWPYSGCYVDVIIRLWAQNNKAEMGGKRLNASLEAVRFWKNGDPFSGSKPVDAKSAFDDDGDDVEDEFNEDDEDETPKKKAKKRPVDDDEDEDEAPKKKKKRPVDEDDDDDLI